MDHVDRLIDHIDIFVDHVDSFVNMEYIIHGSKIWLFCKKFTYLEHIFVLLNVQYSEMYILHKKVCCM